MISFFYLFNVTHIMFLSAVLPWLLPLSITGLNDLCNEDYCNSNGFCSTNWDTNDEYCYCFDGYYGVSCEFSVKDLVCLQMDCGFSGIQGECIIGPTNYASCYCYPGWEGTDCSISIIETSTDYCAGIACNGQGVCLEDLTSENNWSCVCNPGWSGQNCGTQMHECGHDFLLDIFTRLTFLSNDLGASSECAWAKPVIFSGTVRADSDPFTFPFCVCASMLKNFGYKDYDHLLNTCNMDAYRKVDFVKETESYCPLCNESQDAIMEDLITTKSAACWHFVYQRATMGLYWRSRWKCSCVLDIGNYETSETILTCPFTQHTSSSDMISHDNCGFGRICDWESMYVWFEKVYSKVNLDGAVTCKAWMEDWIFTVPGEQRFEFMEDTFCPCLDYLKGTGEDFENILDCIPVTFHQLSMLDLYNQICYDPLVTNHACLNFIGYGAIRLGSVNYTAASLCYGAVELASSLYTMNDNLQTLMCDCAIPLYDNVDLDEPIVRAIECVTEYFTFDVTDCPDYGGDATDNKKDMDIEHAQDATTNTIDNVKVGFFSTISFNSLSSWEIITIIEISFCVLLSISAIYLQTRKTKLNR